ncbi:MAG TPA: cytochrome c oxidase assembly protein [Streptosporangiaceae bacterium]|nr:cytochrome c oxidase assembly protein [Streptosporangiaceae bacterium]
MRPVLAHWSAVWPAVAIYLAVALAHLAGTLRGGLGAPGGRRAVIGEAALFQGGLLLALLAVVSPLRYWSGIYVWVHALQDLVLAVVAPGLIVVGAPWPALARSVGRRQIGQGSPDSAASRPSRPPLWLRWPLATVVAFNVIWLGWHLPALFDKVPVSAAVAALEYATYLGAGILFWLQVVGSRPWAPAAAPMRRTAFLVGTVAADTILGMVLVFGSGVFYRFYDNPWHHVMTVVDDQQLAGAVLWMGVLPPMIAASVAVLVRWLNDEESEDLSAGIDRLLTQRSSAWPSRPRFR